MRAASDKTAAGKQTTPQAVSKANGLRSDRATKLRLHLANIYQLFIKELRSIRHDPIVLAVMVYSFTIAVYAVATGAIRCLRARFQSLRLRGGHRDQLAARAPRFPPRYRP